MDQALKQAYKIYRKFKLINVNDFDYRFRLLMYYLHQELLIFFVYLITENH